jgi:PAS domain-containing protein
VRGQAYRLRSEVLCWELDQGVGLHAWPWATPRPCSPRLPRMCLCNRHHSVDQQLCRWLLFSLDLIRGHQLDVTQEMISNLLGVRREGVTEAAGKLQAAGLIHYRRGHITVTDRAGPGGSGVRMLRRRSRLNIEASLPECDEPGPRHRVRPNPGHPAPARRGPPPPEPRGRDRACKPGVPWDTANLVHELQVHQIELEMHNEELQHAYQEADALREKYADIYDFAPVAYVTLDAQGVILQVNLAGAILLGIKRSQMGKLPLRRLR